MDVSRGQSVLMPVMGIRVVWMRVHQWLVLVPMRVRLAWRIVRAVGMLMMGVMNMPMGVRHRVMRVLVFVTLGDVQVQTQPH